MLIEIIDIIAVLQYPKIWFFRFVFASNIFWPKFCEIRILRIVHFSVLW